MVSRLHQNYSTEATGSLEAIRPRNTPKSSSSRKHSARQIYALERIPTFYDDSQSSEALRHHSSTPKTRHARELSIRDVTRDSMVDNLVQSLNFTQVDDDDDDDQEDYQPRTPMQQHFTAPTYARHRPIMSGNSSDVDLRVEDYFTPEDNVRTNPMSNYNEHTNRLPTPRPSNEAASRTGSRQQARPSQEGKVRQEKKKSRKHSKSSSQDLESYSPKQDRNKPGSSSSRADPQALDPSSLERPRQPSHTTGSSSILDRARPLPAEYHDFEAAPTPNVPLHRPPIPSSPSSQRFMASEPPTTSSSSPRQANFKQQHSSRNKVAALTGSDAMIPEDRRPYPPSSHGSPSHKKKASDELSLRSKMKPHIVKNNLSLDPLPKEKTGFFKRVFGSSRSNNSTLEFPPQLPPIATASQVPTGTHSPADVGNIRLPPPPPEPEGGDREPPQILHKKSSFFRRRKKTVPEREQAPVQSSIPTTHDPTNLNSPSVSSLEKVMQPFFSEHHTPGLASPQSDYFDSREEQPKSPPRSAASQPKDIQRSGANSRNQTASSASSRREVQRPSTSLRHEQVTTPSIRSHLKPDIDESFLHDSSGTEGMSPGFAPSAGYSNSSTLRPQGNKRPRTSPNAPNNKDSLLRRKDNFEVLPKPERKYLSPPPSPPSQHKRTPTPLELSQTKIVEPFAEDGWVMTTPTRAGTGSRDSNKANRIWLNPTESEEKLEDNSNTEAIGPYDEASIKLVPQESNEVPQANNNEISPRELPTVQVDGEANDAPVETVAKEAIDPDEPTESDYDNAKQLLESQDDPRSRAQATFLLGQAGSRGERIRRAYMSFFDFASLNILLAFRDLCARFTLKGETQQVDRVVASFSQRWCECNPDHGFKSKDVVHLICYSLLLLNTDLHIAEMDQKMTKNQFIKNTVPSIRRVVEDETGQFESTIRPNRQTARGSIPWRDMSSPSPASTGEARPSLELRNTQDSRLSIRAPQRPTSEVPSFASPNPYETRTTDASDLLLHAPFEGSMRAWEAQVETLLRDYYNSIRSQRIPLQGGSEMQLHEQHSSNSLTVASSTINRSGSIVSKSPSENLRGRSTPDFRNPGSRWGSKPRTRTKVYPGSTLSSSRTTSRTSLEDSIWSPSGSSTWSKSYFGRAQSAMSTDSLGSHMTHADYGFQQSIGFANALSHAIIREEGAAFDDMEDDLIQLEDETLELAGAPWAKEGIVQHKHHLETTDKRSKDRNWNQCFAVVEKGWVRLFSFNSKSSLRAKDKALRGGGVVGGGNWTENAEALGSFMLRQTIANALPPPGYSKTRPHVFALSLPTGAVHLFQVGTPEIVKEFVSTVNYWSARLSKEPLIGGVSNIEYGWGDNVVNMALLSPGLGPTGDDSLRGSMATDQTATAKQHPPSRSSIHSRTMSQLSSRPSFQGSIRSSNDPSVSGSLRTRMPSDRIHLSEWTPPQQSLMASTLPEDEQLESLRKYVNDIEEELQRHNELRAPMLLAFSPRQTNATKAMANWERKSSYLLREIVKFRTYCDSLVAAQAAKEKVEDEKKEREDELAAIRSKQGKQKAEYNDDDADSLNLPEETMHALALAETSRDSTSAIHEVVRAI